MFRTIIAVVAVAVASLLVGGQAFGALTVYISSGGSAGEYTLLSGVMTARGYTVINGVAPTALSGTTNFGAANVVLLNMGGSLPPTIPSDGQTNLVNFVKGGKGLVTGEWLIWNPPSTLSAILPATQSGWITTAARTYTRSTADALMNDVLGTKAVLFNGDNHSGFGTYLTPKTGATTFYTASGGAGLVGWTGINFGGVTGAKVASFGSIFGDTTNAVTSVDFNQLLGNAVNWASDGLGTPAPAPEPASLTLMLVGGAITLIQARRSRAKKTRG
ncbi:MAG: hypothetical protein NTY65_11225 [Planctomycetota bacterium]|jgi:hypothetical protein|nr:hypothetical protein [Planctomycetota bacterium]